MSDFGEKIKKFFTDSKKRRTIIVILLIVLIILILLLISRCTATVDPLYTDSDQITDNRIGKDTDPPSPPDTTEPPDTDEPQDTSEPTDTTEPPDDTDEPYSPPATEDSSTPDEPYYPPATEKPETTSPSTTKPNTGDSTESSSGSGSDSESEETDAPTKITLKNFFGIGIDHKEEFATQDWTPGSKETIGYYISADKNTDLYITLKIHKDITPATTDSNVDLANVLNVTIKYYDFERNETNQNASPVLTETGTFASIAKKGAILLQKDYTGAISTCEIAVEMDTSAGNAYMFATLEAEFVFSAK